MNRVNLTSKIVTVLMLFCTASQAMKPGLPAPDKFITEVQLTGKMPDFQRIYFMPYSEGPRMGIQEVTGAALNAVQDYASVMMQKKAWKPDEKLVYKLEKPILINVTTHNPAFLVSIERLNNTGNTWRFKEKQIKRMGESNILTIDLGKDDADQVSIDSIK